MLESPSKINNNLNIIQFASIKTSNSLFDVTNSSQQTEQILNTNNNNSINNHKNYVENSGLFFHKENIDILKWNINNERSNSDLTLKDLNVIDNNNNNNIINKGPLNINDLNDNNNNKILNNNNEYDTIGTVDTPISTMCNYYLQTESNMKKSKLNNINNNNTNNNTLESIDEIDNNNYNNYINKNSLQENGSIINIKNNNNNLTNINFNSQENGETNNLELSSEILNLFSEDILYLYNKIISFIKEEPSSLEKEKQDLNKKEGYNNTLKSLKDNDNFINYKNDFNFILSQEQRTSRNIKSNIESKIRLFNKIKSSWEETLYYIYNNYSKPESIKIKLNIILELINDYKYLSKSNKRENYGNKIYNNFNVFNSARMNNNNFRYGGNVLRNSSYDRKYN